jgi:hypothetical protein
MLINRIFVCKSLAFPSAPHLANVEARTLPLPRLKYHDTIWEECVLSIGHENIMNIRMVNGGSIRR